MNLTVCDKLKLWSYPLSSAIDNILPYMLDIISKPHCIIITFLQKECLRERKIYKNAICSML